MRIQILTFAEPQVRRHKKVCDRIAPRNTIVAPGEVRRSVGVVIVVRAEVLL